MACIMSGEEAAASIDRRTAARVAAIKNRGVEPSLAIVRVGEPDDAVAYERGASGSCARTGVSVRRISLPASVGQREVESIVAELSADAGVHGILLLDPLPRHVNVQAVKAKLDPSKDVDGVTSVSFAKVYAGYGEGFAPCTAEACMRMLCHFGVECSGKRVAVIGHSLVVGRPVAMMLLGADATPTICHIKTVGTPEIAREADIVIVATGLTQAIGRAYFRAGQAVLDVGIGLDDRERRLRGDVVFNEVEPLVDFITPVPGGVGVVTSSVLASHVAQAAEKCLRIARPV